MVDSQVLTSLYVINKYAKQFASEARRSYQTRDHSSANLNSDRKEALYSTKASVLLQIHPQADYVEKHHIDGSIYYYFEFEDGSNTWEFHIPVEEISIDSSRIEDERELPNFESDEQISGVTMTLKTALRTIHNETGVNANKHLPAGASASKWPYLY